MALGTYERYELGYLLSRVRPGGMFIDIGAHVGYMTLPLARRLGPPRKDNRPGAVATDG